MDNTPNILKNKKKVLVDGFLIRNTLDTDFTSPHWNPHRLAWYSNKYYIPDDEIWIDRIFKDEIGLMLKVFEMEVQATDFESYGEEREMMKKKLTLPPPAPSFIVREEETDTAAIKFVDGTVVRKSIAPGFVFGGYSFVYDYVPAREIWIDSKIDSKEIKYILTHETVERNMMAQGRTYDIAHDHATAEEKEARRNDGIGFYPGDSNYPWYNLSNEEIIKKYAVEVLK